MIYIVMNVLAILAATVAGLGLGALLLALGGRAAGSLLPLAALAFVAEFWLAAILAGALILAPPEGGPWTMAVGSAVVIWIGFVVPTLLVTQRYRGLSLRAGLTDCAHWLGVMVAQAIVLQAIGLQPPPA